MLAVLTVLTVLTVLGMLMAWTAAARAQAADRGGSGSSSSAGTEEIDTCTRPLGIGASEAENQAADHYDRGINLYEQGDYEGAIEEFIAAYCHKPSYPVLKDIAQSFERMVDYEKAVAYLQRYIAETPPERHEERQVQSARVQVLRNLPARVRIATAPPGAAVTLSSPSGVRARGLSNDDQPLLIRKGVYTLSIELDGHEPVTETIEVKIGQPYSYYYRLEPTKGTLRVMAVPATARIFIDKRWVALGSHLDELPIGTYVIEVEADGYLPARREVALTETGQRLTMALAPRPRDGRTELLIAASVGGAVWSGSAAATIFGAGELLGGAGTALGLGIGLGGSYLGVPHDIGVGTSSFIMGSTLIGAAEGLLLARFFSCESRQDPDTGLYKSDSCGPDVIDGATQDAIAGATLASSVAGAVFGALVGPRLELSAGDAAVINSGALWGAIGGMLFYVVFEEDVRVDEPLVFSGLNLGILTGALVAQRTDASRAHVGLIDLAGLAGLILGASVANIVAGGEDSSEQVPHFTLAGMTVGLITGAYLTRHMDEPSVLSSMQPRIGAAIDAAGDSAVTFGLGSAF